MSILGEFKAAARFEPKDGTEIPVPLTLSLLTGKGINPTGVATIAIHRYAQVHQSPFDFGREGHGAQSVFR
jgi:hypothetical protein